MNLQHRLAVSSVTFRDESLERALSLLSDAGFLRLDLTAIRQYCEHFDPLLVDVGEEECARIRDLIASYDMQTISITTYPANPLSPNLTGDDWVEGVDAYVRLGLFLEARYLIYPPGRPAPAEDYWLQAAELTRPWLRDAVERTLNANMLPVIALQSNSLLRTSQQGLDFLRLLGMVNAGLAVDPAHLAAMGEDPAEAIRRMGAAVEYVVLRDTDGTNYNLPPGSGKLDYQAILQALDDVDYTGPLVLAIDDTSVSVDDRVKMLRTGRERLRRMVMHMAA